jgi:Fuc2NAc and GlcNAc transferase
MAVIAPDWQSFSGWIVVGLIGGVLSYFSCAKAMSLARKSGMITQPGTRQSHEVATPTGGGLGLIFSIVAMSVFLQFVQALPVFWWQRVLPGVLLLAVIGWRDDKQPVSSLVRLMVQLAVSVWLLSFAGFQFSLSDAGLFAGALLAMVWTMNLYNFMDGSNGMAGFQGVFAGVVVAVLFYTGGQYAMALLSLAVAAACAGFLPLNFPHARVFMGDVASVPLGCVFASFAVYGIYAGVMDISVAMLIMSVFIVDATLTLLARVFRGERWYTAHAQHIYQRLIAHGWSHSRVLVVYQAINLMLVLPAIVLAEIYPQYAVLTVGLAFLFLGACWHIANRRLGMLAKVQLK